MVANGTDVNRAEVLLSALMDEFVTHARTAEDPRSASTTGADKSANPVEVQVFASTGVVKVRAGIVEELRSASTVGKGAVAKIVAEPQSVSTIEGEARASHAVP